MPNDILIRGNNFYPQKKKGETIDIFTFWSKRKVPFKIATITQIHNVQGHQII